MIPGSTPETCFLDALKDYYPKPIAQKKGKKSLPLNQNPESPRSHLLMYHQDRWSILDLRSTLPSDEVFQNTVEKVVSLNFIFLQEYPEKDKALIETHLIDWIRNFNSSMMIVNSKKRKIRSIEAETIVQFSSTNTKGHIWLSNFFKTIIYDPQNLLIYPSTENGYVIFKAVKAGLSPDEIFSLAICLNPKEVKQRGADLWIRVTPEDDQEAICEMNRLVSLKFQQNPFLADWLKKSTAPLQEFTNDYFWGSAMGTIPLEDENSNHLGKIIETIRRQLNYVAIN